jgi:hypothetical protein
MNRKQGFAAVAMMVMLMGALVWAQNDAQQQPPDNTQQPTNTPPPGAYGQSPTSPQVSQFPPLSSLDAASLEPNIAARSFLQPDLRVAEYIDTNATNSLGHNTGSTVALTHVQGSVDLQRFWSRYATSLAYVGDGALYWNSKATDTQAHQLYLDQRVLWRTGVLQFRDVASYLPEGAFGSGAFGGSGAVGGLGGLGGGGIVGGLGGAFNFFGGSTLSSVGQVPSFGNVAIIDLQQNLSPRTAFTAAGGYGLTHFTQRSVFGQLVNSRQATGQAGFNYLLNRRNSVAIQYIFGDFAFPRAGAGGFTTHIVHLLYGYQISGRMDLILGGGPQYIRFNSPLFTSSNRVSASGQASLRYRFQRASVSVGYSRFVNGGSGFFSGSVTNLVRATLNRPFSRKWNFFADVGYSLSDRLQSAGNAVSATTFHSGYAGVRLSRTLSRTLTAYGTYQFNDLWFNTAFCGTASTCNRTSTRSIGGVGLDWHPHAIRLD